MLSWKVMLGYHEGYGTNTWWVCRKEIELHIGDAILNENCEICEIWCLFCNGLLGFWNTHLNLSLYFDSWTCYTMYLVSHGKDMLKLAWKKWIFPSSFVNPQDRTCWWQCQCKKTDGKTSNASCGSLWWMSPAALSASWRHSLPTVTAACSLLLPTIHCRCYPWYVKVKAALDGLPL